MRPAWPLLVIWKERQSLWSFRIFQVTSLEVPPSANVSQRFLRRSLFARRRVHISRVFFIDEEVGSFPKDQSQNFFLQMTGAKRPSKGSRQLGVSLSLPGVVKRPYVSLWNYSFNTFQHPLWLLFGFVLSWLGGKASLPMTWVDKQCTLVNIIDCCYAYLVIVVTPMFHTS